MCEQPTISASVTFAEVCLFHEQHVFLFSPMEEGKSNIFLVFYETCYKSLQLHVTEDFMESTSYSKPNTAKPLWIQLFLFAGQIQDCKRGLNLFMVELMKTVNDHNRTLGYAGSD